MEKELIEMFKEIVPQLGSDAKWVFIVYFLINLVKNLIWASVVAIWPIAFYKSVESIRKKNGEQDD